LIVLGDDMIWWGYAGLSGAIVLSMALLASIMGVSTEAVLSLVARSGVVLLAVGIMVHLVAIGVRPRGPKPVTRMPVAVPRAAPAALLAPIKRADAPAKATVSSQSAAGSAAVLWPAQKAAH
jgi:hypothetical protein